MRLAAKMNETDGIVTYAYDERPSIDNGLNELYYASEHENDKCSRYCFADIHHSDRIYGVAVSRMVTDDAMYLTLLALQIAMILSFKD